MFKRNIKFLKICDINTLCFIIWLTFLFFFLGEYQFGIEVFNFVPLFILFIIIFYKTSLNFRCFLNNSLCPHTKF